MFFSERTENLKEILQTTLVRVGGGWGAGGPGPRPGAGLEKYLEN